LFLSVHTCKLLLQLDGSLFESRQAEALFFDHLRRGFAAEIAGE
jgi:hypothetical protein